MQRVEFNRLDKFGDEYYTPSLHVSDDNRVIYTTYYPGERIQMIAGIYLPNVTKDELELLIRGPFGGKFESYGDGKFVYTVFID